MKRTMQIRTNAAYTLLPMIMLKLPSPKAAQKAVAKIASAELAVAEIAAAKIAISVLAHLVISCRQCLLTALLQTRHKRSHS